MRVHLVLALTLWGLVCLSAQAADVNGQWTAQVPGRQGQTVDYTFTFKVDGDTLTGMTTTQWGERPISDGKVTGDDISFTQTVEFGGNEFKFLYKGKVSGDEIKFTREREGGEGRKQEFTAKRKTS